jgi:16S rRNA (cytidine1402-2'-O)-methyltransferase
MAGTLFIVATPIGNLEDLSFRALRTLKEADLIAAEDTRRTAKLLAHYAIQKPMVSLHEHNERREAPRLIARLEAGESIALVSDAGTPGISDPGEHLVHMAREAGIRVSPIPGPSAIMAALSASGVPAAEFIFLGFPPRSGSVRSAWFERLAGESKTCVFFEAPHRILRTMDEVLETVGERPIFVHRELTKIHEISVKYTNNDSLKEQQQLGEFVVVVGNRPINTPDAEHVELTARKAVAMFGCLTENSVFSPDESERLTASALSLDQRVVHKAVKKARIAQKRRDQSLS